MDWQVKLQRGPRRVDEKSNVWESTFEELPRRDGGAVFIVQTVGSLKVDGQLTNGHDTYQLSLKRLSSEAEKQLSAPSN
jgi:hypothetical protein